MPSTLISSVRGAAGVTPAVTERALAAPRRPLERRVVSLRCQHLEFMLLRRWSGPSWRSERGEVTLQQHLTALMVSSGVVMSRGSWNCLLRIRARRGFS